MAIDARRRLEGMGWEVVIRGGRERTGLDAVAWAKQVVELGAGEILLTSMDADGTQAGYDLSLTHAVVEAVSAPVIASGGAGTCDHIAQAVKEAGAAAALLASLLHFGQLSVAQIKDYLIQQGIPVRL